jgi:hypothetical protein
MQVQQRKPKACAESAAAARGADQQQCDCRPLEAGEESLERSVPRKRKPAAAVAAAEKRWSSVAYVVLAAFVMATVFAVLGGRRPAVWIAATKALRRGECFVLLPTSSHVFLGSRVALTSATTTASCSCSFALVSVPVILVLGCSVRAETEHDDALSHDDFQRGISHSLLCTPSRSDQHDFQRFTPV